MQDYYLESSLQGSCVVVATPKHQQAVLMLQLLRQHLHLGIKPQHLRHALVSLAAFETMALQLTNQYLLVTYKNFT